MPVLLVGWGTEMNEDPAQEWRGPRAGAGKSGWFLEKICHK